MSIEITKAKIRGFCGNNRFGVIGSINMAKDTATQYPNQTYMLGEIVHNKHVVNELTDKFGIKIVDNIQQIPKGSTVIIRAHGAPPSIFKEAKKIGLNIIDATCPLVTSVHKIVKNLAKEGFDILYIASKLDHDEAIGVYGEAPNKVILTTIKDAINVDIQNPAKTVVLTQTTLSLLETEKVLELLKNKYPEITVKKHICYATTKRQKAVIDLAKKVDLMIIVGAPNSSNSNRLKEVATETGTTSYIVDNPEELDPEWFRNIKKVGTSSGASTPEWLLDEVIKRIEEIDKILNTKNIKTDLHLHYKNK